MSGLDIESFDEVDASEGGEPMGVVPEPKALAEAEEAMAKSAQLCKRLDPEEEPYKSKYLAREALKIGIAKCAPHAAKGSAACKTMVRKRAS